MAHQSHRGVRGAPLGDVTNTYERGDIVPPQPQEDSKARDNQRHRKRYASSTREQKDERNMKERERRRKKEVAIGNRHDVSVSVDVGEDDEWLHRGNLTQDSQLSGDVVIGSERQEQDIDPLQPHEDSKARDNRRRRERYASMTREQKDEKNKKDRERRRKKKEARIAGGDILTGAETNEDSVNVPMYYGDVTVSRDEDKYIEWMHMRHFNQNNDVRGVSKTMDGHELDEWLDSGNLTQTNDLPDAGVEILISAEMNDDCLDDKVVQSTVADGGKVKRLMILCVGRCFSSTWFVRFNHSGIRPLSSVMSRELTRRRNFFVDLLAHEANAWRSRLPSIVKHYLRRITDKDIK